MRGVNSHRQRWLQLQQKMTVSSFGSKIRSLRVKTLTALIVLTCCVSVCLSVCPRAGDFASLTDCEAVPNTADRRSIDERVCRFLELHVIRLLLRFCFGTETHSYYLQVLQQATIRPI